MPKHSIILYKNCVFCFVDKRNFNFNFQLDIRFVLCCTLHCTHYSTVQYLRISRQTKGRLTKESCMCYSRIYYQHMWGLGLTLPHSLPVLMLSYLPPLPPSFTTWEMGRGGRTVAQHRQMRGRGSPHPHIFKQFLIYKIRLSFVSLSLASLMCSVPITKQAGKV